MKPTDCPCGFKTTSFRVAREHTRSGCGFKMLRMARPELEKLLTELKARGLDVEAVEENGRTVVRHVQR